MHTLIRWQKLPPAGTVFLKPRVIWSTLCGTRLLPLRDGSALLLIMLTISSVSLFETMMPLLNLARNGAVTEPLQCSLQALDTSQRALLSSVATFCITTVACYVVVCVGVLRGKPALLPNDAQVLQQPAGLSMLRWLQRQACDKDMAIHASSAAMLYGVRSVGAAPTPPPEG